MAKIFKGFRQVSATQFEQAKNTTGLAGYLWFVRTEVSDGETNNVANDEYDIYFGSKQYGHFCAGELPAIKAAIQALEGNVEAIETTLSNLSAAVEANATAIAENKAAHEANAAAIENLGKSLEAFLVKDVKANDNVLTVADGILSAQVGLEYTGGRIVLTGKNGEEITGFSAADFVKDSVLEDVEIETREDGEKYIVFTWKTEGEETKTDELKVSDFAKLYTAGTALELAEDGVTFNVKVAQNANFLSVNANNELIVDDITTDKTMLKEAITIEGGPLASAAVKNAFEGGVIPAGTDIQAVLKALLCVEIYPEPTANTKDITYSVSIDAPTIKANVSANATVEIGQSISFSAITATAVSISKTAPKVSTFTHGYSDTLDGAINSNTSISGAWTINQMDGHVYELSASATNFDGTVPTTVTATTAASCSLAACTLKAVLGTNTYSVTEDAPKHEGTYTGVESKYVVSNLGGRAEAHKSPAIAAKTTAIQKDPDNKTASFTVTGVYPVFNNMVSTTASNTVAVDKKMTLSTGKTFEISYGPETNAFHAFAYPATHTLSKVEIYNTMSKTYEEYTGGSSTGDATYAIQNVDTAYKVWRRAGNAYSETTKFKFTLNKNLNTK